MFKDRVFNISNTKEFEQLASEVFQFQFENNRVYRSFCDLLYVHPADVKTIKQIPFLPIQFFKSHTVVSSEEKEDIIFTSSGTTGSFVSKHYVQDLSVYETSFMNGFDSFYGNGKDYVILA
ncbi:MAG: acyl transferase, partial [Flavobacteriaceae bacterium]|nr:acyl transferase [Flavobacteriaceae bacterium]